MNILFHRNTRKQHTKKETDTVIRAGLTSMPIMPWHGAPGSEGPPWAARIFLIFKFQ